ncbi:MAG TPA: hypothetical protein VFH69_08310, partial [Gemmatimonadota bacterium]|nr:hypothetical protein [Gemmatimonadota bacterium]
MPGCLQRPGVLAFALAVSIVCRAEPEEASRASGADGRAPAVEVSADGGSESAAQMLYVWAGDVDRRDTDFLAVV